MKSRRKILLGDRDGEGSLDQDIDDYEDSRIELQAIGLNLTSVLMNPRETILEEFMDEFEIEQSIPMEFTQLPSTPELVDEGCGEYFLDPQCWYNKFRQRSAASTQQLAKLSRMPANAEVAFCFATVPELYFHPDYSIRNPETFQLVLRNEERQQEVLASKEVTEESRLTPSSKSKKSTEDQTLTNYLDLVEVALLRQIMTKSPAFFRALDDIYDLQAMVSRAATRVIHIRRHFREFGNSLTSGPLRLTKLEQRRVNEALVFEKAQYMQRVLAGRIAIQNLLDMDDYIGALEVISSTKAIYMKHLTGIISLKGIGSQLDAYDAHVANVMCDKFVSLAINWTDEHQTSSLQPCDDIAEGEAALLSDDTTLLLRGFTSGNSSNPEVGVSEPKLNRVMHEPLGQLIHALLHVDRLQYSLDQYGVRLQDSIPLIIRTCLSEYINSASLSDIYMNGGEVYEDSKNQESTTPYAQRVRGMANENFLACLSMCYESLMVTIARATSVHVFLTDALNDKNLISVHRRPTGQIQLNDQSVDDTLLAKEKTLILDTSVTLLLSTCDLAQKSVCQLLQMRKDSTGKMTVEQMKFCWEISLHFISSIEQLKPTNISLSSQTLRVGLLGHSKRFFDQLHESYKGKLVNTLDSEKWVQCDVSSERQSSLDRLTKGRAFLPKVKTNGTESIVPNGTANPTSNSVIDSSNSSKKKDLVPIVIDGVDYKVVWSALFLCEIILTYLEIAILFPPITREVISKTVDICALFDTRSRQLVLGAQAIQSAARLQSIAAKHLAIMAQCLSFFRAIFPHLRVALLAQLPVEQHSSMVEIDRVSQSMTDHHSKVLSKFVSIVGDFVDSSAIKLRQVDWDRFSGNCEYFEEVSKNVTAMHRVLQSYLPPDQMKDVFTRIFILLNTKIPSHFDEILPSTQTGKQRIVDEIGHLCSNLARLKFTDSSTLTIEDTFRRKFERQPPVAILVQQQMEGEPEGVERYVAYFRNIKAVVRPSLKGLKQIQKSSRVLVHSAEVGDAFRPISLPSSVYYVANAISVCYVAYEVNRSYRFAYHHTHNPTFASIIASKTFMFEVISSLLLPAIMIHGAVHSAEAIVQRIFAHSPPTLISRTARVERTTLKVSNYVRSFGPTTIGLVCIPFLPMIFDKPVERALDDIYTAFFPLEMEKVRAIKAAKKV